MNFLQMRLAGEIPKIAAAVAEASRLYGASGAPLLFNHSRRRPSSVNNGSTAVISGSFEAMSRAYPPVATTGNRGCSNSRFSSAIISRTNPR